MTGSVLIERQGGVTVVTLNRPEQANALNAAVRAGIREAFVAFEAAEDAHVAVLAANGSRAFCAGADLREMAATGLGVPPRDFVPPIDRLTSKPGVTAVKGAALPGRSCSRRWCRSGS